MIDRVIRGRTVVTPSGTGPAAVHVRGERIATVAAYDDVPPGAPVVEADDAVIFPGLVDTHVHVNEPGRTEWEGFTTATRAAAAGGVTTLVDMPLNSIPAVTTPAALAAKREAAAGQCRVDVGFWGGVVPGNTDELAPLAAAGVLGFKAFLAPSGVDEFPHVGEDDLRAALPVLAELGLPLLVHAELPGALVDATPASQADRRSHAAWLASRPDAAEMEAVELLIRLCRETGARLHVVHVSSADVLPPLRDARREGLPLTAETCPHYLRFAAEDVSDGATEYKCAPPIRGRDNREALWRGLGAGDLDFIVSDHSPAPPALKRGDGDFFAAWGGIAGLELRLPVIWTGARERGHTLADLAEWLCTAPARLAGLARKGRIEADCDADLVVWRPDAEFVVDPARLHQRHPVTPYAGERLWGTVDATWLRGRPVFGHGADAAPAGHTLSRNQPTCR